MEKITDKTLVWLQQVGISEDVSMILVRIGVVAALLLLVVIINTICRKALLPVIRKITSRTEFKWDDYLLGDDVLNDSCRLIAPVLIYVLLPLALPGDTGLDFLLKCCQIYLVAVLMKLLCSVITAFYQMTSEHDKLKDHSMKGFYQMLKLAVICVGTIIIISMVLDKSPVALLTGLGAGTAVLMLVFQDTIKGFVAGIQLIANDMLRPGDWITMPKYGADGDVIEVTLTTVKVRNWDKTITTVPPYVLVNDSFQNWRGMFDIGGRRIKRSINIDMNTVRFCTPEEMEAYRKLPWMDGFEAAGQDAVNLHVFRHYLEYYLRNHPKVNTELILLVRQLQPTPQGIPVELYFFSADTRWVMYEKLQAEVFDHVIAVLDKFDLKVFQSPTGQDFQNIN